MKRFISRILSKFRRKPKSTPPPGASLGLPDGTFVLLQPQWHPGRAARRKHPTQNG